MRRAATGRVSGAGSTTIKSFRSTRSSGYDRFPNPLGFALGGGSSRKRTPTQPGFRQASLTCRVVPANTSNKSKVFGSHSVSSMTKRAPLLDRLEIRHVSTRFSSSLMRAVRATGCRGSFRMLRGNCNSNQKNTIVLSGQRGTGDQSDHDNAGDPHATCWRSTASRAFSSALRASAAKVPFSASIRPVQMISTNIRPGCFVPDTKRSGALPLLQAESRRKSEALRNSSRIQGVMERICNHGGTICGIRLC